MKIVLTVFALVVGSLTVILQPSAASAQPLVAVPPTTVYIVRHAEKQSAAADTPLSDAGRARAKKLAHVLKDAGIEMILVTEFQRTQQTAKPLANANGLTPIQYPAATPSTAVSLISIKGVGKRILVVAHSNTVDDIASGLGATGVAELLEPQFDRLFVVLRVAGTVHLQRLRYGTATQ